MKKFTLILILTLMSVTSFAQPSKQSVARKSPVKGMRAPMPKKKVSLASANDLAGQYVWNYKVADNISTDPESLESTEGSDEVTINVVEGEENTILISGMFPNDLKATVDTEQGYITIPDQVAYSSESYGDCQISGIFYYEGDEEYEAGWYYTDIYADLEEDGSLTFYDTWLTLTITSGTYAGYSLGGFYLPDSQLVPVEEEPAVDIIELIEIDPAEGEVEKLQSFKLTFGGEVVTVNEDIFPTLDGQDGGIAVSEDGKTVSIDFEETVSAAGNYVLMIPAGAILYKGKAIDPLSFKYNIKGADYTINPDEGEVEKLETFVITFNNYTVRAADEASAILLNTETEAEVEASVVTEINGGRAIYISFPEVTAAGTYELIVMSGSIQKDIDDSFVPELTFQYTIKGSDGIMMTGNQTETIRTFDVAGRIAKTDTKGMVIQQIRQEDGTARTIKIIRK